MGAPPSPVPAGGPPGGRRHRQGGGQDHGKRRGPGGFEAGKKIKGRKRPIRPAPGGLLVAAQGHAATLQDRAGAPSVLASIRPAFPGLRPVFAADAQAGPKLAAALERTGRWTLEIVQCPAGACGFEVLPRPWGGEGTLARLNRKRRLAKDFEARVAPAPAGLFIPSVQLITRRLARY